LTRSVGHRTNEGMVAAHRGLLPIARSLVVAGAFAALAALGACLSVDAGSKRFKCEPDQVSTCLEGELDGVTSEPCAASTCKEAPGDGESPGGGGSGGGSGGGDAGDGADGGVLPDGGIAIPAGTIVWEVAHRNEASGFYAVTGLGADRLWAGGSSGRMVHFDGTGWSTVFNSTPDGMEFRGLWAGSDGAVFAGAGTAFYACKANCRQSTQFVRTLVQGTARSVCGRGATEAYGVTVDNNAIGRLYRYDATGETWALQRELGTTSPQGCWVAPGGTVWVAAQSAVLRVDGATLVSESPDYDAAGIPAGEVSTQFFHALVGNGNHVYAVGERRRILVKNGNSAWKFAFNPNRREDPFYGLAGVPPNQLIAAGPMTEPMAASGDGSWGFVPKPFSPSLHVFGAWAVSADEFIVVGSEPGLKAAVYRGKRR
jgi:hypothetical protein